MYGHRASFPASCAAPRGDPPSLTRQAGLGNAFRPPSGGSSPDGPTPLTNQQVGRVHRQWADLRVSNYIADCDRNPVVAILLFVSFDFPAVKQNRNYPGL